MPQIVDREKNRKIICYRQAFELMLNSQYDKVIEMFIDKPTEIIDFVNMFQTQGDYWASNLSSKLNDKWKDKKADYFVLVLDKYLILMVKEGNKIAMDCVNQLKIAKIELEINILQGCLNEIDF